MSWDQEIEVLTDEIAALKNIAAKITRPDKLPLLGKKSKVVQSRINIAAICDRIVQWSRRDYSLEPREKAVIQGAAAWIQEFQRLQTEETRLWTRMLWVRLIQARMGDRQGAIGTDELVGLAVRYSNLTDTERELQDGLAALQERQKDLLARYYRLGVADANRHASGSLQARLGLDFEDAMNSPTSRALAGFVDQLAAPVHRQAAEDEWITKVKSEFTAGTASVLEQCLSLVLGMFGGEESGERLMGGRSARQFKDAVRKLETLEREGVEAEKLAQKPPPPAARPKMVQNRRIRAKK